MLSRAQSSVAVAGATGRLGYVITEKLLTTFKPFFSRVVAITRDASSPKAKALASLGAELHEVHLDDPALGEVKAALRSSMNEIDVVVNALGMTSAQVKDVVAETAIEAGAKVYFPSEFGVDHRLNDFPGFDHEEWEKKRRHIAYANELAVKKGGDVKVIAVYTGLFLEDSLNPRFGFDISAGKITILGPPSSKITFTSRRDIARSVAQLAILAMVSPASLQDNVPSHVRIAGCTRSVEEIAQALNKSLSQGKKPPETGEGMGVALVQEDISEAIKNLKEVYEAGNVGSPASYIRVLMGGGKLDFSQDNSNQLVNPNERLWKWNTIEETVRHILA
ncbi:NAD-binding protein [Sanghuangporus baumii]|uniref:NAD-binding protein n=1 Tax=Sanghuangporus baumii TaxID=108892 RepID=A0A9Q5HU92_SANBA|nr:NAD-binding protein [Sanghuangporus baumii]